jgi:hypothetical protein
MAMSSPSDGHMPTNTVFRGGVTCLSPYLVSMMTMQPQLVCCTNLKPLASLPARSASWPRMPTIGTLARAAPVSSTKHDRDRDGVDDRAEGAAAGAGIGAAVGGIAGLLAGLGMIAIPGIGPVVAAGWLASTAAVAAAGGVAGGLLGALAESGVSQEDAHIYAEGVRRGGTLLTVRVPDGDCTRVQAILDRSAVNIRERGMAYRQSGWSSFDPNAPAYTLIKCAKSATVTAEVPPERIFLDHEPHALAG